MLEKNSKILQTGLATCNKQNVEVTMKVLMEAQHILNELSVASAQFFKDCERCTIDVF